MSEKNHYDVIIIGAGAAGLMSAIEAGKRKRKVLVLDHSNKVGKKILMSGGGRCNFTNYNISHDKYVADNKHFVKSSLSRYTQWDFIGMVSDYDIPFHEKTLGQLFCDNKASDIVKMLLAECEKLGVEIKLDTHVNKTNKNDDSTFQVDTKSDIYQCQSLVIATGGLSIPTMGATGFGYKLATQYGITVNPQRAGLVPFVFSQQDMSRYSSLKGISIYCNASTGDASFSENLLFTHKGLSGPAILQISSYWNSGESVSIDLSPKLCMLDFLERKKDNSSKTTLKNTLLKLFPKKFVICFYDKKILEMRMCDLTPKQIQDIATHTHEWNVTPKGTEGYKTAEITLGGVSCNELSSKTFETKKINGLYFIGEVVDIAGWLGGYNFQYAWASGWASGQVV